MIPKLTEMPMFAEEMEAKAIERIRKFDSIAQALGFQIVVGFSGGKDSQVVYDLCERANISFTAYYNECFESPTTKRFIAENYPKVIKRRYYKVGFLQNIEKHKGLLPTPLFAYCCENYKHNPQYIDNAVVTGVRAYESLKRRESKAFEVKNKTFLRKNKELFDIFADKCRGIGSPTEISLKPIVDWTDDDVWSYIFRHNLPINPEYHYTNRIGCMICCKCDIMRNAFYLKKYPKLIDAVIRERERASLQNEKVDWVITSDSRDYEDDEVYYVCRWLNYNFSPFSKKQQLVYEEIRKVYDEFKRNEATDKNHPKI